MKFFHAPKFLLLVDGADIFRQEIKQHPSRHTLLVAIVCKYFDQVRYVAAGMAGIVGAG